MREVNLFSEVIGTVFCENLSVVSCQNIKKANAPEINLVRLDTKTRIGSLAI